MSKRNICYIKPQDPSFLSKLKEQIGYKEGPTVETKRQKVEDDDSDWSGEERPEREDEKPQIVVLQSGDLTAEEVAKEEARIAQEATETPADLNQPIVFQKRKTKNNNSEPTDTTEQSKKSKPKAKASKAHSSKLSFNDDEDEDEDK